MEKLTEVLRQVMQRRRQKGVDLATGRHADGWILPFRFYHVVVPGGEMDVALSPEQLSLFYRTRRPHRRAHGEPSHDERHGYVVGWKFRFLDPAGERVELTERAVFKADEVIRFRSMPLGMGMPAAA